METAKIQLFFLEESADLDSKYNSSAFLILVSGFKINSKHTSIFLINE